MRYLRLYLYFLRFSFSKAMEFRIEFFFRIVMDIIFYVVNILFFKIIYGHTESLGGWNEKQALFFVSTVFVVDALNMTIFASNAWWLPIYINRGDLDHYLTKPISPLFFLSLKEFAGNSFLNLILAFSFFIYSFNNLAIDFNLINFMTCSFFIIVGTVLYFLVNLLFILPVFWTHSSRAFGDLFFILAYFMERPDRIFYGASRVVLTSILPFSLMASWPASFVLDGLNLGKIVHISLVVVGISLLVRFIWIKGLRSYSSASS